MARSLLTLISMMDLTIRFLLLLPSPLYDSRFSDLNRLRLTPSLQKKIVSCTEDGRVVEHTFSPVHKSWKMARVLTKATSTVTCMISISSSSQIVLGMEEGKLLSLSLSDGSQTPFLPVHPASILAVQKDPTRDILVRDYLLPPSD